MKNLNELAKRAHENAVKKGFWDEKKPDEHYLMLIICELSEAVEADRKNKRSKEYATVELHSKHNTYSAVFEFYIKDTVEDELADAFIRLLDLAGHYEIPVIEKEVLVALSEDCCRSECFTESVYYIITQSLMNVANANIEKLIHDAVANIIGLCNVMEID